MNYRVNYLLLEQLPQLYPSGSTAFYRDCEISDSTWWRWIKNKRYRIMRIIELCNTLFIPFEYFISEEENTDIIPSAEDLFRDENEFNKIYFGLELMSNTIAAKRCARQLVQRLGVGRTTLHLWLNEENSDMTMECFVQACNILNTTFSDFISVQNDDKRTALAIDKLRSHNRRLSMKIKKLSEENEQLRKEKDRLLAIFEKHVASYPSMAADNENLYT